MRSALLFAHFDYRWQVTTDCVVLQWYDDATRTWETIQKIFGTMHDLVEYVAAICYERDQRRIAEGSRLG